MQVILANNFNSLSDYYQRQIVLMILLAIYRFLKKMIKCRSEKNLV